VINFDYLTLLAFFEENKDFLLGARLQKIQQPTRRDFILSLRNQAQSKKMYVNINPSLFHLCFANEETLAKRDINLPQKPPMFCMLLRKYIESAKVVDVCVPPYERILEIYFKSINEFDENLNLCLAIEMMGKYSNLILYNIDTGIIIGCAHNVGSDKSREREVGGTIPYIYPPKQEYKTDILRYNGDLNYDTLNQDFLGISKSFQDLCKDIPLEQIKDYMELKGLNPAISSDKYSLYSELLENPILQDSVNSMIDNYYSMVQGKAIFDSLLQRLIRIVAERYKKCSNSMKKMEYQVSKKDKANEYKKYGDLILSNLYSNKDFSQNIIVKDWDTNQDIRINLDEELTLKENAQRFYKLFNKSKDSREKLEELLNGLRIEKDYFEQVIYSIESADSLKVLREIEQELVIEENHNQNNGKKQDKNLEIDSVEINGFKVYIGKNNKQNDLIVSKLSRGEDYWFHTQNTPGSHILLKVSDNNEPDEKTIYECCKLAKKYSSAYQSLKVGVIYTKRKFLKKPPGANLGYVLYKNEKEIIVNDYV